MSDGPDTHWQRVLWKKQDFPDNYVPSSFLSSLRTNANYRPHTYWALVCASYPVTQHLASVFNFLAVFILLRKRNLDPRLLVWLSVLAFLLGYLTLEVLDRRFTDSASRYSRRAKAVKSSILVFLALLSLSPVLRTLTAATSSDSIWALSACLFVLNCLLADYTSIDRSRASRERLTSVLSMNAAISSSVVLASRLADDLSVFALILFSVQSFTLFPLLRRRLQSGPKVITTLFTVCLIGSTITLTAPLSSIIVTLYIVIFTFVTFIAPGILMWAQKFKNELRGTWDPAVPKVNSVAVNNS
ncbi:phosphatidylinositol N-acetylglucosaminyltransferase [Abortiporus biennis]|nr:phosphatidylinositol N-acetylglucosaminyltransferase [Abortiporus biennis]